jgi:hypothetical protein
MTLIAITSDREAGRGTTASRSSVQRQTHSEHKERSPSGLAIFPSSDFVLVRTAGVTGPFETETRKTLKARLSVPQSQSAAVTSGSVIPAVTSLGWLIAGARCVLARHRPFIRSRRFLAPGSRLPGFGRAIQPFQKSSRGLANAFQVFSVSARVLGLAVGVYGQHTGRREMKCPTKALKDLTK